MNGKLKFHKANGPAFSPGEIWKAASGSNTVAIIDHVQEWSTSDGKWDYSVFYRNYDNGPLIEKDVWNFQVRYYHPADENLQIKKSSINLKLG